MKKLNYAPIVVYPFLLGVLLFCLLLLTSCATWQKIFVIHETFEVKHNEMTLDVKMPPEVPTEYIKTENSQFVFITGSFFAIRYAFDDAHTYDFIDFVLEKDKDKFKICAVVSWNMSNNPEPESWLYINECPIPSTAEAVIKFLREKLNARSN